MATQPMSEARAHELTVSGVPTCQDTHAPLSGQVTQVIARHIARAPAAELQVPGRLFLHQYCTEAMSQTTCLTPDGSSLRIQGPSQ